MYTVIILLLVRVYNGVQLEVTSLTARHRRAETNYVTVPMPVSISITSPVCSITIQGTVLTAKTPSSHAIGMLRTFRAECRIPIYLNVNSKFERRLLSRLNVNWAPRPWQNRVEVRWPIFAEFLHTWTQRRGSHSFEPCRAISNDVRSVSLSRAWSRRPKTWKKWTVSFFFF